MSIGTGGAQSFHRKTSFSSAPREPALPPMKIRSPRGPDSPPKKLAKNTSNSSTHTTFEGDGNLVLAQASPSPRVDFSSLLDEQLSAAMSATELDAVATALRYRSPRPAAAVPPALVSPPSSASPRPLRTARTRGADIQRPMSPEWTSEWLDEPVTLLHPLPPPKASASKVSPRAMPTASSSSSSSSSSWPPSAHTMTTGERQEDDEQQQRVRVSPTHRKALLERTAALLQLPVPAERNASSPMAHRFVTGRNFDTQLLPASEFFMAGLERWPTDDVLREGFNGIVYSLKLIQTPDRYMKWPFLPAASQHVVRGQGDTQQSGT
jgi:hypothetical protein